MIEEIETEIEILEEKKNTDADCRCCKQYQLFHLTLFILHHDGGKKRYCCRCQYQHNILYFPAHIKPIAGNQKNHPLIFFGKDPVCGKNYRQKNGKFDGIEQQVITSFSSDSL